MIATTNEATQATSGAIDHEVHDKTAAADGRVRDIGHVPLFGATSATVKEGVAIEGEAIEDRATTSGHKTDRLLGAHAQVPGLVKRPRTSRGRLPKPSKPTLLPKRSPRM